jgi:hypothetical protein
MAEEDDRGTFWRMFSVMVSNGMAKFGEHYAVKQVTTLNIDKRPNAEFPEGQKVLLIYMPAVQFLYSEMLRRTGGANALPFATIKNYLMTTDYYIGGTRQKLAPNEPAKACMAFKFDQLGLDIEIQISNSTGDDSTPF